MTNLETYVHVWRLINSSITHVVYSKGNPHFQATSNEEMLFAPIFITMIVLESSSNLLASQPSCHYILRVPNWQGRKNRSGGTSIVWNRYQALTGEDIANRDLMYCSDYYCVY